MSQFPTLGKPGYSTSDSANPKREETVRRLWDFVLGLWVRSLRIYGEGAATGKVLVASNADGDVEFSSTLPATTAALTGQTISQTATLLLAPTTGEYLATVYLQCTTGGAAGTLDATFTHTDDVGLVTTPVVATVVLTGTGRAEGRRMLRCSGGGIDYTLTVTGAVGGPIWAAHIALTKLR